MKVKHLDHLNLTVEDLEESVRWYGRVFGFQVVERGTWRGAAWAIARSGEAMLCMYERPGCQHLDSDALAERGLHGIHHFAFRIDDREEWEATLERAGVEVPQDQIIDWPSSRSWYVFDPTGYEIEVALWNGDQVRFPGSAPRPEGTPTVA